MQQRRAELRRKAKEAARTRERQAAAAAQNEAEESDATEEEATREVSEGGLKLRIFFFLIVLEQTIPHGVLVVKRRDGWKSWDAS